MDILSARKKAAERAADQKQKEFEAARVIEQAEVQQPMQGDLVAPGVATVDETMPAAILVPEEPELIATAAAETAEEPPIEDVEMLSFRLGEEEYALMVNNVKEVLKNRDLTPVPNAPDYILGVTALRGPILPVIDLCKLLGIPSGVRDEKSRILVVTVNDEEAGIVVDRVTGVVRIHPDTIRPAPDTLEHGAEFLQGIARKDEKLYILLDIEKALGA